MMEMDRRPLGVLCAALLASAAAGQSGPPPTAVTVEAARIQSVQESRRVTGELRAVRRSRVATQEQGLVIELPVEEGTRVEAGDVLARLDSRRLDLELVQGRADVLAADATIEQRQATLEWRQRELELYRQSAQRGAANIKEILDAESNARVAEAQAAQARRERDMAQARVDLLQERLADMTVAAPFAGIVVTSHVELGEWVGEGDPIVELVSIGEVEAWLSVPQRFFAAVAGHASEIRIGLDAAGRTVEGTRSRVVPLVDPRVRAFDVVVTLDDDGGLLTPGMSVTAWVPTGTTADRLTIHADAVLRNEAGAYVYVARGEPGGPLQAVPAGVKVLFPAGQRVVIEPGGVQEGDLVVVEGNERLFPMMPVTGIPRGDGGRAGGPR